MGRRAFTTKRKTRLGEITTGRVAPHQTTIFVAGLAGWGRYRSIFNPVETTGVVRQPNKGFCDRRADFRSGGGAMTDAGQPGGINNFLQTDTDAQKASYCKFDYKTTLSVPPFKTFQKDIYCRSPTWIPYIDSCDVMINFHDQARIRAALLQCASLGETEATLQVQRYDYGLYAQPYLEVEWCVPPVQLRPSYTIPCWRNQQYSQRFTFGAENAMNNCTFQGIRLDSMPSLISVHVTDGESQKKMDDTDAFGERS